MHSFYYIAVVLFAGILMARVARRFRLPNVTGYILAGVAIGPSFLGFIPQEAVSSFNIISEAALGFIAYSIGSEFNFKHLKKLGPSILLITIAEALGAVLAVTTAMILVFRQPLAFSLVLGSIAAATAPAATIMVIRQYNARGIVVDTLLPIVAMDDAVAIMAFGIAVGIAQSLSLAGGEELSLLRVAGALLLEILVAVGLGFCVGLGLSIVSGRLKGQDTLLSFSIACIFLTIGLASALDVSTLLSAMAVGATVSNLVYHRDRVLSVVDRVTPPIFVGFFTLSGADLKLSVLQKVGWIGIGYVVFRVIGKLLGSYVGARCTKAPAAVQKYLGLTLVPQAGVAIGLSLLAEKSLPGMGIALRNIILGSTVIYELIGPVVAKQALLMAGEIPTENP